KCNHTVTEVYPPHTNACQYARIGLAVWGAKKDQFAEFDRWVFQSPYPPSLEETAQFAARLVGQHALERQLHDRWIDEQIHRNVQIYEISFHKLGQHSLPQLIAGTNLTTGTFSRMEWLLHLLDSQFALGRNVGAVHEARPQGPFDYGD